MVKNQKNKTLNRVSNSWFSHPSFRNHSDGETTHENVLDGSFSGKNWAPRPHEIFVFLVEFTPVTMDMDAYQLFPISITDDRMFCPRVQIGNMLPEGHTIFIWMVPQHDAVKDILAWWRHRSNHFMGKQNSDGCRSSVVVAPIYLNGSWQQYIYIAMLRMLCNRLQTLNTIKMKLLAPQSCRGTEML